MTEKRYFSVDYDEEYYIFDSTKISEEEVLEKAEYSYDVFGESLTPQEHLDLLNENEQLKQSINNLMDSDKWWEKKAKQRVQELENENEQLKEKNATIKGKIINAIIESNKVECSCNPCVCEQYVKKELMRD